MTSGRRARVLLIEDVEAVRRGTRLLLERQGYSVEELPSGVGAEEVVERCAIDVVVTDLAMPDRQGVATLRALREQFPSLPIIVVTATAFSSMASHLGANRCFTKPVLSSELSSAIESLLPWKASPSVAS